jgi:pilus assembly protein CpaE
MRAGAREYFTLPFSPAEIAGALNRAAANPPAAPVPPAKTTGQLFVFLGAKGGCGVTSIAANFAVHVAQESKQGTLLIDLGLPLGDAGINLGMVSADYSTANALQDPHRLDARFLSSLVNKHSTGLSVLAAPGEFPSFQPTVEAIDKLIEIARQNFSYVVVDAGSRIDLMALTSLPLST